MLYAGINSEVSYQDGELLKYRLWYILRTTCIFDRKLVRKRAERQKGSVSRAYLVAGLPLLSIVSEGSRPFGTSLPPQSGIGRCPHRSMSGAVNMHGSEGIGTTIHTVRDETRLEPK